MTRPKAHPWSGPGKPAGGFLGSDHPTSAELRHGLTAGFAGEARTRVLHHFAFGCQLCFARARRLADEIGDEIDLAAVPEGDVVALALAEWLWARRGAGADLRPLRPAHAYWLRRRAVEPPAWLFLLVEASHSRQVALPPSRARVWMQRTLEVFTDPRLEAATATTFWGPHVLAFAHAASLEVRLGNLREVDRLLRENEQRLALVEEDREDLALCDVLVNVLESRAQRCALVDAMISALSWLDDALELLHEHVDRAMPGRSAEVLIALGAALMSLNRCEQGIAVLEQALAALPEGVYPPARLTAHHRLAGCEFLAERYEQVVERLRTFAPLYDAHATPTQRAEGAWMLGTALVYTDRSAVAPAHLRTALEIFCRLGQPAPMADTVVSMLLAYGRMGGVATQVEACLPAVRELLGTAGPALAAGFWKELAKAAKTSRELSEEVRESIRQARRSACGE